MAKVGHWNEDATVEHQKSLPKPTKDRREEEDHERINAVSADLDPCFDETDAASISQHQPYHWE